MKLSLPMKIDSFRKCAYLIGILFSGVMSAQEIESDSIVVVKPYTPSVRDAFKVKQESKLTDTIDQGKLPVSYRIFSVPVASTFSPAKGRPASLESERLKVYDNYVTLGAGSYTGIVAEFYSNLEVSRTDNFGIFLTHNSAQGNIEGVALEDNYFDTELNLNYSSRQRNSTWKAELGGEHGLFNWYGLSGDPGTGIDPQHHFFSAYAGGEVAFEDSFFEGAKARYRLFGDDQGSTEQRFVFRPTLEVPIGGELFHTNLTMDYVGGSFDRQFTLQEGISYSYLNFGLDSSLLILRDDLTLNLGAAIFYNLDRENQDGTLYVYPKVTASYQVAGEYFIAYAGLEGGLLQNSYYEFAEQNPFVAPTLEIRPTDRQSNTYIGAKGKLSNSIGFNVRGKYLAENAKPLFRAYPQQTLSNDEDYAFGNSFGVLYDNVKTVSAFGELSFDVNRSLNLRVNGEYFLYDTAEQEEAWNLPNFKVNLLADYQMNQWFAGANVFFMGTRKDLLLVESPEVNPNAGSTVVTLDPYLDLNANIGYRFNEQLSIFARGNNLLGENYERWLNYRVMGRQILAGATYKFDFGRR